MKKRIGIGGVILLLVVGVVIAGVILRNNSQKIIFQDDGMATLIAESVGVESVDKLRVEDLEKVEMLNIGYTGYYDTLLDIEKCVKLERLVIGEPEYAFCHYYLRGKEIPESESKERIEQIESELGMILKKCPNLKILYISNKSRNFELNNLDFLKDGQEMISLNIEYQSVMDYSIISKCVRLKTLSLYGNDITKLDMITELSELNYLNIGKTNVSQAEDILKLKNLKYLNITDTPLAENAEQLELIQKQFPEIDIQK